MIHNSCNRHSKQPCPKNGCCRVNYPKDFQPHTQSNGDGCPLHQRKQITRGDFAFKKKQGKKTQITDNR